LKPVEFHYDHSFLGLKMETFLSIGFVAEV